MALGYLATGSMACLCAALQAAPPPSEWHFTLVLYPNRLSDFDKISRTLDFTS